MKTWNIQKGDGATYSLTVEDVTIDLEVKSNYAPTNQWFALDEKVMIRNLNSISDDINTENKNSIIRSATTWKKYCKTKGFSIFDLYNLTRGIPHSHIKTEFTFKEDYLWFYGNCLEAEVKALEEAHGINILVMKNKVFINLNGSDLVKNYTLQSSLSVEELNEFIGYFKAVVDKDVKLKDYMAFASKHGLNQYCYVAKSYGFGVFNLYNPFFGRDVSGLKETLDGLGIPYKNEYSDKSWIYRFKVAHKAIKDK